MLKDEATTRQHKYLKALYKQYNASFATDEIVAEALDLHKTVEVKLHLNVIRQRAQQLVKFENVDPEFFTEEL